MSQLPVRRMVLYKHGVAFFTRGGELEGDTLSLTFRKDEINDVLKSLAVLDQDGGQVRGIHYETPMDRAARFAGSSIHLGEQTSLVDLLRDLRGRRVTLRLSTDNSPGVASGRLIGLNTGSSDAHHTVTVLTTDGRVRVIPLPQVQEVKINDDMAENDLHYFLDSSMSEDDRRTVIVRLNEGGHNLTVHYVAPAPTWRVSYRVVAETGSDPSRGKLLLQGWGIFDNRLDEDLDNVMVTLVAGQPISFIYDLYASRIPERPTIEDESRIAPGPVEYAAGYGRRDKMMADAEFEEALPEMARQPASEKPMFLRSMMASRKAMAASAPSQATTRQTGETFQYIVSTPVSVKRGESALVPILSRELDYERELLYNASKMTAHPVAALRFSNSTGLTLERGPVTLVEDGDYKGEAVVAFSKADQEVYLPFAVELGIQVREDRKDEQVLAGIDFSESLAIFEQYDVEIVNYSLDNQTDRDAVVTIEAPKRPNYEVFDTLPVSMETLNERRWRVKVPARSQAVFTRRERVRNYRREELRRLSHQQLQRFLSEQFIDQTLFDRLQTLLEAYDYIDQMNRRITELEAERQTLYSEQEQYRKNMTSLRDVGREGELRTRILDQMDASQSRLEAIKTETRDAQTKIERAEKKIEQLIVALNNAG